MRIGSILLGVVAVNLFSESGANQEDCLAVLYNVGLAWKGCSFSSQFPGETIAMTMSFDQQADNMTVVDSKDPEPITIPVKVTCTGTESFFLEDELPKTSLGHMQFKGFVTRGHQMIFNGSKTLNGEPYDIGGNLTAMSQGVN